MPSLNYPRYNINNFVLGQFVEKEFCFSPSDLSRFADVSGDYHPLHTEKVFAKSRGYSDVVIHGMAVMSRSSAFVAETFVGSHGLLVSAQSDFRFPIFCDEKLLWYGTIDSINKENYLMDVQWTIQNSKNITAVRGFFGIYLGAAT